MRLFHVTSPANAVAILEQGIFYPVSNHELNNDNGLNCFASQKSGYFFRQPFEGYGAKLILEWTGKVVTTSPDTSPPLPINVLHDQRRWRCFIRAGTDKQYLRIVGVIFSEDIENLLDLPFFYSFLPSALRKRLIRKKRLKFLRIIRQKYKKKPHLIVSTNHRPKQILH